MKEAAKAERSTLDRNKVWVLEPRRPGIISRVRETWQARQLLRFFAYRSAEQLIKRTALGWIWLIIHPIIPVAIMTVIFGLLVSIDTGKVPYLVFLVIGMGPWTLTERCLVWGTRGLAYNRPLINKIYFPRIVVTVASITPGIFMALVHFAYMIAMLAYFAIGEDSMFVAFTPYLLLAAAALILALLLALGLSLFTSIWEFRTRDTRFALGYVMRVVFYATPVLYPASVIPEAWRPLYFLNPLAGIVETFRNALMGDAASIPWWGLLSSTVITLLILTLGTAYFFMFEAETVDRT